MCDKRGLVTSNARFHLLSWTTLLLASAVLTWISWQGWGDPIIDFGREVYVPWQIREGRVLYRDFIYNYGPVAPYLMAAVTALLGDTLAVYAATGAAIGLATMTGLYASGCRLGSRAAGFVAALLFVLHSFFGHLTWGSNYVMPYAYAATISMLCAVWSLYALLGYLYRGRRRRDLAIGAALMIATLLTKPEVGAATAGTWVLAAWAHRVGWRDVGLVAGATIGVCGLVIGVFVVLAGVDTVLADNLFRFAGASDAVRLFARGASGLDEWVSPIDLRAYRIALPLALVLLVWPGQRSKPIWVVAALTALSAPRILFAFDPGWYGFYLFVPAYLLLGYAGAVWLARWRYVAAAAAVLAGVLAFRFNQVTIGEYQLKTAVIRTARGTMRDTHRGRARAIEQFVAFMAQTAATTDTLVVLPEGATLNWWTGLRNPTRYHSYVPPELTDPGVEPRMAADIAATAPTYIAINSRSLEEFGVTDITYLPNVLRQLGRDYEIARTFGEPGAQAWRIVLMTRKVRRP